MDLPLSGVADAVGNKVAERWLGIILPGLIFWSLGPVVLDPSPWTTTLARFPAFSTLTLGRAFVLGVCVVGSVALVRLSESTVLRWLEGYGLPGFVTKPRLEKQLSAARTMRDELKGLDGLDQELKRKGETLSATDLAKRVQLDARLRRFPENETDFLPTTIGNTLRSAERWPLDKYGLDAIVCWPQLWLVMPAEARAVIGQARASLDLGVRLMIWSLASVAWAGVAAYHSPAVALVIALLAAFSVAASYVFIKRSAMAFGDLLEAAFDVHRHDLYRALGVPRPGNAADEKKVGATVNTYLFRGSEDSHFLLDTSVR